jgi:hypothetical protein
MKQELSYWSCTNLPFRILMDWPEDHSMNWKLPASVTARIKDPPMPKTDTQEAENLDNFSSSRGCKHVLTTAKQTRKHKMADSGSSLYP